MNSLGIEANDQRPSLLKTREGRDSEKDRGGWGNLRGRLCIVL